MSKYLFIIFTLFISANLYSQYKTIEVTYELIRKPKKIDSNDLSGMPPQALKKVLEGMKKTENVRDYFKLIYCDKKSEYSYTHSYNPDNLSFEYHGFDYYKDFHSKKVISISPAIAPDTKIENNMSTNGDWTLIDGENEKIAGYICKKAISKDGTIEAWYTTEIKLKDGPEIFSGLPGLILKINENKGQKIIIATSIEKSEKYSKINIPNRPKTVTLKQFKSSIKFR